MKINSFVKKITLKFSDPDIRMPFSADNEFLVHFWQDDLGTFFRLGLKTKSDFFV